jgi:PH domain
MRTNDTNDHAVQKIQLGNDEAEEEVAVVGSEKSTPMFGLSELSKQLRTLQLTNHAQGSQIDKLERKLQILSDLKGVSVNDLKSALNEACQGEAYNELRMEVETLRAQLDLARSNNKTRFTPKSNAVANLQLRIGELEEVEESLQSKMSTLYDDLRQQSAKATQFQHSSSMWQNKAEELQSQYETLEQKVQQEYQSCIDNLKTDLESAIARATDAESLLQQEKERVSTLLIRSSQCKELELQLAQKCTKIQEMESALKQQKLESVSLLVGKTQVFENKLERMENRAKLAEEALQDARMKISGLEQQVATIFSMELIMAQQKEQIEELSNTTGIKELERSTEMEKLQEKAASMEAKLQEEISKSTGMQNELLTYKSIERQLGERDDELETTKSCLVNSESMVASLEIQRVTLENEKSDLQILISNLESQLSQERQQREKMDMERSKEKSVNLQVKNMEADIEKLKRRKDDLKRKYDDSKSTINQLKAKMEEKGTNLQVQIGNVERLEKQLTSTINEANLKKEQFKSRFKVQDTRIEDLEQQLSSLVTAFHLERDERTDEQKARKESLLGADSKVAHQLHNWEEGRHNTPVAQSPSHSPMLPMSVTGSTSAFASPFRNTPAVRLFSPKSDTETSQGQDQVAIEAGYLFKREGILGWKKRYCYLQGSLSTGMFALTFSDGPGRVAKGAIEGIQKSVSQVQRSTEFPKQPFCFVLQINRFDAKSPTIWFATNTQHDLDRWFKAFTMITMGTATQSSVATDPSLHCEYPVGSRVVIVDLVNNPDYNGLNGIVLTPLKDMNQYVMIDSLQLKVKLSPANLEFFAIHDSDTDYRDA